MTDNIRNDLGIDFGTDLGRDSELIEMTAPLRWPNECQKARDGAAERIALAIVEILKSRDGDPTSHLYKALFLLDEALRLLEQCGAKTTVRSL
jgi:hypothetical protein